MGRRTLSTAVAALWAIAALSNTGCVGITTGVDLGFFGVPIPVSPYFGKMEEDEYHMHERYDRAPVLGPLVAGPIRAMDPPSDDEVWRRFERARPKQGGLPLLHEIQRNDVRIVKKKIADYIDPPRVYPLIGPAQLHHAHYKCTVFYTEKVRVGWPNPHTLVDEEAVEVIYIDHNHLHMAGNVDPGTGSFY